MQKKINQIVKNFNKKRILVVGDSILDIHVYGTAIGKSLETPTIVAREDYTKISCGGSLLVVRNLLELGVGVVFISLLGNYSETKYFNDFSHKNLIKHIIVDNQRKTTIKKRFWIDSYKLLQIDNLDNVDIGKKLENEAIDHFYSEIKHVDLVVVSDYRHGLMTPFFINEIIKICKKNNKKLLVDSQISHRESNHKLYNGCDMFFLSENEASIVKNSDISSSDYCIKKGSKGSLTFFGGVKIETNALKIIPIDTCGAGDAFLAAFAASGFESISCIDDIKISLKIANVWAGLSCLVKGTEPPKKKDLLKQFEVK